MQWLDQLFTKSHRDKLLLISGTGMLLLAAVAAEVHAVTSILLLLTSITLLTLTHKPRIARAVRRSPDLSRP